MMATMTKRVGFRGDRMATLREEAGMSQGELGERLKATQQQVSRWEREKHVPRIDQIIQLAGMFNVTTDYLLGLTDERSAQSELRQRPDIAQLLVEKLNGMNTPESLEFIARLLKSED